MWEVVEPYSIHIVLMGMEDECIVVGLIMFPLGGHQGMGVGTVDEAKSIPELEVGINLPLEDGIAVV